MLDRARASKLGYGNASGDQVIATTPVPSGYHWIVTMLSVWRTVLGSLNTQAYDTIASGVYIVPPSVTIPTAPGLQAILPPQLIHLPKNMDLFFEGVPEIRSGVSLVSRARIDVPCNDGIIVPSLSVLVAFFVQGNAANPIQPGVSVMSFQYTVEENCK